MAAINYGKTQRYVPVFDDYKPVVLKRKPHLVVNGTYLPNQPLEAISSNTHHYLTAWRGMYRIALRYLDTEKRRY